MTRQEVHRTRCSRLGLQAISEWAENNHVKISVEKTKSLVICLDTGETCAKARPPLGQSEQGMLPIQVRRPSQNRHAEVAAGNRIPQALTEKDWGLWANSFSSVYRPKEVEQDGLATEMWGAFAAGSHVADLEAWNNRAARIIMPDYHYDRLSSVAYTRRVQPDHSS